MTKLLFALCGLVVIFAAETMQFDATGSNVAQNGINLGDSLSRVLQPMVDLFTLPVKMLFGQKEPVMPFNNILIDDNIQSKRFKRRSDGEELIFATTICRHGDRNIIEAYKNDPYQSPNFWPEGFGQLTNIGKKQHYELGSYFRLRYKSLLEDGSYSDKKVYIRSTDIDRVLMSAQSNMAGLFPPSFYQIWNRLFNWQPIPIHTQPISDDYVLVAEKRCDRYNYLMLDYMNTTSYKNYFIEHKSLITYLEKNSGKKLTKLIDIFLLYDTLYIERLKYKRLPDWAEAVMQMSGEFEYLAKTIYDLYLIQPDMRKLKSGFLYKEILDRFKNKTLEILTPDRSLWMYFAHDNTITNMLISLGLYKTHSPPYASCLLFELNNGKGAPYVQLFYKTSSDDIILQPLVIPSCGTKCPLDLMYKIYEDVLPTKSYDDECALQDGETLPDGVTSSVYP